MTDKPLPKTNLNTVTQEEIENEPLFYIMLTTCEDLREIRHKSIDHMKRLMMVKRLVRNYMKDDNKTGLLELFNMLTRLQQTFEEVSALSSLAIDSFAEAGVLLDLDQDLKDKKERDKLASYGHYRGKVVGHKVLLEMLNHIFSSPMSNNPQDN